MPLLGYYLGCPLIHLRYLPVQRVRLDLWYSIDDGRRLHLRDDFITIFLEIEAAIFFLTPNHLTFAVLILPSPHTSRFLHKDASFWTHRADRPYPVRQWKVGDLVLTVDGLGVVEVWVDELLLQKVVPLIHSWDVMHRHVLTEPSLGLIVTQHLHLFFVLLNLLIESRDRQFGPTCFPIFILCVAPLVSRLRPTAWETLAVEGLGLASGRVLLTQILLVVNFFRLLHQQGILEYYWLHIIATQTLDLAREMFLRIAMECLCLRLNWACVLRLGQDHAVVGR